MVSLSPNVGKIAGITIQIHWTLIALLLLALLTPLIPGEGFYLLIVVILLYACVLLHELAHSFVSKSHNVKVKKIILLPIGGASIIDADKVKPDAELKIALAGPICSIVLGVIFGAAWFYIPASGLLSQVLLFMFEINILLGLFNLLPGFPLDGGRVLRSYLQRRHSFIDSTMLAVRASNYVVAALIIGTVIYAALIPNATFLYREFVVFWDIIIALFLYDGAKAELQAARIKGFTDKMTAGDMLSENYIIVKRGMMIRDLYDAMLKKGTRIALLQLGNKINGITDRQLSKLAERQGAITAKDEAYFTVNVPQVSCKARLSRVIEIMRNEEVDTIVAMKGGKMAGILYAPYMNAALQMHLSRNSKNKNDSGSR